MKLKLRTILISRLLILWMVLVANPSMGADGVWVLCIGSDGHFEVELADDGNCSSCFADDEHDTSPLSLNGDPASESHCGACTDQILSLTDVSPSGRKANGPGEQAPVILAESTRYTVPEWLSEEVCFHKSPSHISCQTLFELASIRLLI